MAPNTPQPFNVALDTQRKHSTRGAMLRDSSPEAEPLLPTHADAYKTHGGDTRRSRRTRRLLAAMAAAALLSLFLFYTSALGASLFPPGRLGYDPTAPDLHLAPDVAHNLAQYAPYYPAAAYGAPPKGCAVDQVNVVRQSGLLSALW
jgi:hypothetical protein